MDAVERLFTLVDAKYKEQKDFAADIGVFPQLVSAWRKRTSKSYTRYLPQITEALDTTAEYILTGQQNSPAPEGVELSAVWASLSHENKEKALEYMRMLKALEEKR